MDKQQMTPQQAVGFLASAIKSGEPFTEQCEQAVSIAMAALSHAEGEALRYTSDGALAECPCCGSLDVGGASHTVHCYMCGLTVTKSGPLQNAIDAWNKRTGRTHPAPQVAVPEAITKYDGYVPPEDGSAGYYYVDGWNDCRDAMLAAAPDVKEDVKESLTTAGEPVAPEPDVAELVEARGDVMRFALSEMVKWYENIPLGNNPAFQYYDLAKKALLSAAAPAAPAVQGEPVAAQVRYRRPEKGLPSWSAWQPAKVDETEPTYHFDEQGWESEYRLLYATPQPAPDVAALVEALEEIAASRDSGRHDGLPEEGPALDDVEAWLVARAALAAHRKQGGEA